MTQPKNTQRDYKDTVFLPRTDFPMKAGLPQKEPGILAHWQEAKLYEQLRAARAGREKFILHDGPPYANGDIHIGHALNRVLKDMVVRTQSALGKDAPFVPGWDCHGLPIEWKVEEQYRKKKQDKKAVPAKEFRAECRDYAQGWVNAQRAQLQRLGLMGDFDHPYLTMDFSSEATIVAELMKFAEAGNIYRGSKPVMWSPVEETALAEAEVEYEEIISTQIDVAFEIVDSPIEELKGAHAVVWTTTPWTIPVNQAIAYGPDVDYWCYEITAVDHPDHEKWLGRRVLINPDLMLGVSGSYGFAERTAFEMKSIESLKFKGSDLAGTVARHPMAGRFPPLPAGEGPGVGGATPSDAEHPSPTPSLKGRGFYDAPRPFLPGDFVTTESGTGLVHMAPDHGEDDFLLCRAHGIEPQFAVMGDGRYRDDWPWLGGHDERRRSVINPGFNAPEGPICSDLREAGALLNASDFPHSYPHSWRSKAKVIFRCTPQWFVPMDRPLGEPAPLPAGEGPGVGGAMPAGAEHPHPTLPLKGEGSTLRQTALAAIAETRFVPEKGRNRIGSMVEGRPDWVLSRQRAWGVPITLFVRADGSYLQDPVVNARVIEAVRAHGVDAWDEARKCEFLGPDHDPGEFEMVHDILDVWFDSGCTHVFTLESGNWPEQRWPADLYLEGSDQHRGWFQSSLLESCATRGRAPYDAVLTHGFTMDAAGKKMSKSLGNTVDPLKVMETYGADIIRLWALSVDFTEDHRIGDEILKGVGDQYRKLRNTFRYLLGALDGYDAASEAVGFAKMPELERYMLDRLSHLDATIRRAITDYDFNEYVRALSEFANEDLSAFFFDIRKDRLYCDDPAGVERRAYRQVLDILFHALVRYAAPVLVFTSEEVWQTRYPADGSVHLLELAPVPAEWRDDALASRFDALRQLRETVTEAIEPLRRDKSIRSSLEAEVVVPAAAVPEGFGDTALAELFITASVTRSDSEGVTIVRTSKAKCGRCWRHLPDVAEDGAPCVRCDKVAG